MCELSLGGNVIQLCFVIFWPGRKMVRSTTNNRGKMENCDELNSIKSAKAFIILVDPGKLRVFFLQHSKSDLGKRIASRGQFLFCMPDPDVAFMAFITSSP